MPHFPSLIQSFLCWLKLTGILIYFINLLVPVIINQHALKWSFSRSFDIQNDKLVPFRVDVERFQIHEFSSS
jgi:hypothetical protein